MPEDRSISRLADGSLVLAEPGRTLTIPAGTAADEEYRLIAEWIAAGQEAP